MKRFNWENYNTQEINEIKKANLYITKSMNNKDIEILEDKIAKLLNW